MARTLPRIALINGIAAAAPPARQAVEDAFEAVDVWNILDDRLIDDTVDAGGVTSELEHRMTTLLDHAAGGGSAGILMTCSLFGFMARSATERVGIPVLAPDDAMFDDARTLGASRVIVVSGVPAALEDSTRRAAVALGPQVHVEAVLAEDAREPSLRGDVAATVDALYDSLRDVEQVDAVLLANYTLSPAAGALQARLRGLPVLSGPVASAARLRSLL